MLKEVTIEKIDEVEESQKKLEDEIPFKVKYAHNYLWQVFWDSYTGNYFMLVPTQDKEYEAFFYLLKQKLHNTKSRRKKKIFIPISCVEQDNEYLTKTEIKDIEKYLWLFTKDWPIVYEVYDKKDNLSIQIVGHTYVYEKIKSVYKIELRSKDETDKFYKLLKAMFILQTELPHEYVFEAKINSVGGLEFLLNNRVIEFDNLIRNIKDEYIRQIEKIKKLEKENIEEEEELNKIREETKKSEQEYLLKEKQIATYLECRKTFFGKFKYFFKSRKIKKSKIINKEKDINEAEQEKEHKVEEINFEEKENYTIEDLIKICRIAEKKEKQNINIKLDKKAIIEKNESMNRKLKNANIYMSEIEEHKKSIFEFWKFANKDENLQLVQGEEVEEVENPKIEKKFDYEDDFEEFGIKYDKLQSEKFSKEELNAIYLATTNVLNDLNNYKNDKKIEELNQLKEEEKDIDTNKNEIDVFGAVYEDKTKIKVLGKSKHREQEKNKFNILGINQKITQEEYESKIKENYKMLENAFENAYDMENISFYYTKTGKLDINEIICSHINPKEALKDNIRRRYNKFIQI